MKYDNINYAEMLNYCDNSIQLNPDKSYKDAIREYCGLNDIIYRDELCDRLVQFLQQVPYDGPVRVSAGKHTGRCFKSLTELNKTFPGAMHEEISLTDYNRFRSDQLHII